MNKQTSETQWGGKMNYPSPCDKCEKPRCLGLTCLAYRMYIKAWWKYFNAVGRRARRYVHEANTERFVYRHPGEVRRYLQRGPCPDCKAVEKCRTPCATYWQWWDARMEWLKGRLIR